MTKSAVSPVACARKVPRETTLVTLIGARSIAFRLASAPDVVLYADVLLCDRIEESVVLRPWGWRRRKLALPFTAFAAATPSTCSRRDAQTKISERQAPLEREPLWPPR